MVTQALNETIPLFSDPQPDLPTGKVVITEMMADPSQVGDATGEYIELFNQTGSPVNMAGWRIVDKGLNSAAITGIIPPGDLFVVGVSGDLNGGTNPGGAPDGIWTDQNGDLTLTNSGDIITVLDTNNDVVASVAYENAALAGISQEITIANGHPNGQTRDADYAPSNTAFANDDGSPGTRGLSDFPLDATTVVPAVAGLNPDFNLLFATQPAVTYTLWKSSNLTNWAPFVGIDPVVGDGGSAAFAFPLPDDDAYFYQIHHGYVAPP